MSPSLKPESEAFAKTVLIAKVVPLAFSISNSSLFAFNNSAKELYLVPSSVVKLVTKASSVFVRPSNSAPISSSVIESFKNPFCFISGINLVFASLFANSVEYAAIAASAAASASSCVIVGILA